MKVRILTYLIGSFAYNENGKLVGCEFFPKDPETVADKIRNSGKGELEEEKRLEKRLRCECEYVNDFSDPLYSKLRQEFRSVALREAYGSDQELNMIISRVNILLSSRSLEKQGRDKLIIQTIRLVDEADTDMNNMTEHLREWYGLHFPELSKTVKDQEKFLSILSKSANKEDIKVSSSGGMKFGDEDLEQVKGFSKSLLDMSKTRDKLSSYVERLSKEEMPNTSAVAGPLLAARLVALAGGLERLAKMPSSKVQLLGAEKALFRHLKGQGKAPKYGILFSNADVQQAEKHLKGKVARLIASRISMASKIDFYSKKDQSAAMKKELERKLKNITGE
ncbi:MAG: hypothetical protein JW754_04655 [Candidatus Aenigmarchaeota archaeon]|nr:hypothetical protein [Candidatus Aenigmarchaeota archaeon]